MTNSDQYPQTGPEQSIRYGQHVSEQEMSYADQRGLVAEIIGQRLDEIFNPENRYAPYVTTDEDGSKHLRFTVGLSTTSVTGHATLKTDETDNRTGYIWLGADERGPGRGALGYELYRFADGPGRSPTIDSYRFDEARKPVPRDLPEEGGFDHNSDREVTFWGTVWVGNLRFLSPVLPYEAPAANAPAQQTRLRKALGFLGIGRSHSS